MALHLNVILFPLFVLVLSLVDGFHPVPIPTDPSDLPVCIIGAGVTGLHIGNLLQAKGYRVEILEGKDRVGGKASTYREGRSVLIEKGPILFTKNDRLLLDYIDRFKLTPIPFNISDNVAFDSDTGSIQNLPSQTEATRAKLAQALQRFVEYLNVYRQNLTTGYLDAPTDLYLPISAWLTAHDLSILKPFLIYPVTILGYGHLDDVPALYIFKYISSAEIPILIGVNPPLVLKEGISVLVNRMAESLDVYLNHKVNKIIRKNPTCQEIRFEQGQRIRKCRNTILAFPPLLINLVNLITDLSPAEREVLGEVKVHRYASAGHHIPPLDHHLYSNIIRHSDPTQPPILSSPRGKGEVVGFVKQLNGGLKNVYSSYSWIRGDFDSRSTVNDLEVIQTQMERLLKKISPCPRTYFLETTEYFPHVTTFSLQNGFYQKFEKMQGQNGLYFATTLLSFESMIRALEMAEDFVLKYF